MNERRVTDAQLAVALRAHLPARAQPGLRERIVEAVGTTSQQRPLPSFLGALSDADPIARRRSLLVAAALLIALAVASIAGTGALRLLQADPAPDLTQQRPNDVPAIVQPDVTPDLTLERPDDVPAFVLSVYDRLPTLPPMAITTLEDGSIKGRIYIHRSGAVRFERYAALDATEPDTYKILSLVGRGEVISVGSERVWTEQFWDDPIGEDPRVFLLAETVAPILNSGEGCAMTRAGEGGNPAAGWTYIGLEYVAGRPAHHVACIAGDLWIDAETALVLRSRAPAQDEANQTIPGRFNTIEATDIEFGEQPASLFDIVQPEGVARITPEQECALDPYCSATPAPLLTAAPGATPAAIPPPPATRASNGWVAFMRYSSMNSGSPGEIYLVREGVEPRRIVGANADNGRMLCPRFSPDGTRLAYGEGTGPSGPERLERPQRAVVIINLDRDGSRIGSETRIPVVGTGTVPCPEWSPDGRRIAFQSFAPFDEGALSIATLGVSPPSIDTVAVPGGYFAFKWSPDGSVIAVSPPSGVALIDTHSLESRILRKGDYFGPLAWSPDGSRLIVSTLHSLRVVRIDGTASDIDLGAGSSPSWSPNGDLIAYTGSKGAPDERLVLVRPDGSGARTIPVSYPPVIWSPDGRRLLYLGTDGDGEFSVTSIAVSGDSAPVVLTAPSMDLYAASSGDLSWQPVYP